MKSRWVWAIALVLLVVGGFWLTSGGHPYRVLVGMMQGAEALAYLPPRREIALDPGPPQPTLSLGEAGIDPESVNQAVAYAEARNTTALVVGLNGHVVFQKFRGELTLDSEVDASGFTPVLSALVLGTALQNGELRDLDAAMARYIPSWAEDPRGTLTWRDLITGNSNLQPPGDRTWPRSLAARYYAADNLGAHLLDWPQADQPDPAGSPAEVDADLLSIALMSALKSPYTTLLDERIWKPLGAGPYSVGLDGETSSAGHVRAGCCVRARIGDWMRIGTLIANLGVFEGNQLLPPDFAKLIVSPAHAGAKRAVFLRANGQFAARDVVWLEAEGHQRMWIVPSLKLVILRVGSAPDAEQGWDEAMIPDSIIRGTRGWEPAGAKPADKVDPSLYAPH
jgi:CubicO group peptidase (beta-lactamase class C family)